MSNLYMILSMAMLDTLNICVRNAGQFTVNENAGWLDLRSSPYDTIWYVASGHGAIEVGDDSFTMAPGIMNLIPAGLSHRRTYAGCDLYWSHFTATLFGGLDMLDFFTCPVEVAVTDTAGTVDTCERMLNAWTQRSVGSELAANAALSLLLAPFLEDIDTHTVRERSRSILRLGRCLTYIETHFRESISVEDLAGLMDMDKNYFSRVFVGHVGITPFQFIIRRRIREAQRMIMTDSRALEIIARELGFSSGFHLSKAFKKIVGMPPKDFRQQYHRH